MSQYAKLKNDELQAKLRERGLPTTGKKADMVDRLTKDDDKKNSDAAPAPSNAHPEDEIDWDDGDDAAKPEEKVVKKTESQEPAVTTQSETVAKAGGLGQPPNPQAVPNQKADIDPSKTDDLSVKPAGEATEDGVDAEVEEKKEPAPSYAAGIAATDLDAEIEKRKKRAEKFGLKLEDDETLKKLERAKKFGESGALKGLDEALPERKERKRGREDNEDAGRNKRRGSGRAGTTRGGNRDGDRRRDNRDSRRDERRNDNGSNWMSAADRERAEARKAKWTKPAANS